MQSGSLNFFKICLKLYSSTANSNLKSLNPAQFAFVIRLGINKIPSEKILTALNHPKLHNNQPSSDDFEKLICIGDKAFSYFAKEYIKTRFPSLQYKFAEIGWKTFLADQNVLRLARFLGIDAACGIDSILKDRLRIEKNSKLPKSLQKKKLLKPTAFDEINIPEIQLECFKALLGLIATENGPLTLRNFLDSRYFNNSQFNPEDLIRPLYPIPDLALIYPNLVFRLHQESGRLSSNSIFIVGVYKFEDSTDCLGEGYGPSIALAQQRAAIDALRKMDLKETVVANRSSDKAKTMECIEELIAHSHN